MLKIRLRRMGSTHRPFYRVVVSDSRRTPTSSALDEIGTYDPRRQPSAVSIDVERFEHWVGQGAQPSDTVKRLVKKARKAPAEATEAKAEAPEAKAEKKTEAKAEKKTEAKAEEAAPAEEAAADEAKAAGESTDGASES